MDKQLSREVAMTLRPKGYRPRLIDSTLARRLRGFGAVEVAGPKFCGKTWTSMAQAESIIHLDDDALKQMVELDAALALEGETPHVIDEWQDVPKVWDATRRRVDETGNIRGQFILTGSSTVDKTLVSHSGAGRIATLAMRPMSLFESGESSGAISLRGLFDGQFSTKPVHTDVRDLAALICRGGWPAAIGCDDELIGDIPAQYLDALFSISAGKHGLDGRQCRRLAVSLARSLGTAVTYKTMYADTHEGNIPGGVSASYYQQELAPFISFFEQQYFIENQGGWDAPVKAKSRIRSKPKRTFADPSLPASLLGMTPKRLLSEVQVFGTLFEELCLRDVRVYCSAMGLIPDPEVRYYGDADGLEVDIIVELPDGRWGAFEVKLSDEKVPEAEKSLLRLKRKVLNNPAAQNREPSFLAVLVGKASFCRQTPSGIYVVPITELGA